MVVEVADGNKLTTHKLCPNFVWKVQGQEFKTNILVLLVEGCEVVLEIQWLTTIGDVKWNFGELRPEFLQNGHIVVLRGMKQFGLQLIKKEKMQHVLQKPSQIATTQLCLIRAIVDHTEENPEILTVTTTHEGD